MKLITLIDCSHVAFLQQLHVGPTCNKRVEKAEEEKSVVSKTFVISRLQFYVLQTNVGTMVDKRIVTGSWY
jgi:hypothetical protein